MLAYYNQAVVTGDPDGGLHVSPIGAFNAEEDRVLLMDVDQECWLPYWTSTETSLRRAGDARPEGGRRARQRDRRLLPDLRRRGRRRKTLIGLVPLDGRIRF